MIAKDDLIWAYHASTNIELELLTKYSPNDPYCKIIKDWMKVIRNNLKNSIDKYEEEFDEEEFEEFYESAFDEIGYNPYLGCYDFDC